ncbi:MAG: hypothetical protein QOE54_817 [Streptosporangiaceae bacterium]|jgi:hypothetical protein|nr:hypothetical protein [Streptosporangiaceae bacterium]MDX6428451.1 hypothetical protein [Streptosporangiaceae bacterium]
MTRIPLRRGNSVEVVLALFSSARVEMVAVPGISLLAVSGRRSR